MVLCYCAESEGMFRSMHACEVLSKGSGDKVLLERKVRGLGYSSSWVTVHHNRISVGIWSCQQGHRELQCLWMLGACSHACSTSAKDASVEKLQPGTALCCTATMTGAVFLAIKRHMTQSRPRRAEVHSVPPNRANTLMKLVT